MYDCLTLQISSTPAASTKKFPLDSCRFEAIVTPRGRCCPAEPPGRRFSNFRNNALGTRLAAYPGNDSGIRNRGEFRAAADRRSDGQTITPEIAALATQFPDEYSRDPADRLIGATARAEGVPLVTRDENIRRSTLLRTIW